MRCKPICWKHFLYFHKILYVYFLPIWYNKGKPLPIMLNDSYLSNIIRTWNCSKFWLFFITKVSFISLVLSDVKKFGIGFISSVITFPYCNYSKKYIGNIFQQFAMQDLFPLKLHSHNFFSQSDPRSPRRREGRDFTSPSKGNGELPLLLWDGNKAAHKTLSIRKKGSDAESDHHS